MKKTKQILSLFLSVCMIISCMVGMSVTASAEPTETLLTTITPTGQTTYSETTAGVVTVIFDPRRYYSEYGWCWRSAGSVTVAEKEGYTITRCVFRQNAKNPVEISAAPFEITFSERGHCVQNDNMDGVTSIEVYGYASTPSTPSTYTITIPSTLTVNNSGWNELTGGISATGTLESGKKLTVTASSANGFKLKSGDNSVGYTLTTAEGGSQTTSWEFTELSNTETTKSLGIIVENYDSKPAGTYTDTVTFTAKVEVAKSAAEKPDIAQADCTFSPSNGKSTLSNANITTSMEYSADNGTTWTDVTSNGSIASLAAGTVQIRVKETADKLASEAVSITVPQVLQINELVGPYTGDKLTCEYYAGETWQALVNRYGLIKAYSGRAAFGSDGFIYYKDGGNAVPVTDLIDNTKTYEVQ